MSGLRALDVGTWDGFWAFEMERRGAKVVAIDLDDERLLDWPRRFVPAEHRSEPRGSGFALAHELRNSAVERRVCSIYNATPQELGTFDLVLCGSVIVHLRDQLQALERIADLCTGTFVSCEVYDPLLELAPLPLARFQAHKNKACFWQPNIRAWKDMLYAAGFDSIEQKAKFKMKATDMKVPHVVLHARSTG